MLLAPKIKLNGVLLGESDRTVNLLAMRHDAAARLTAPGLGHRNFQIRGRISIAYCCCRSVGDESHPVQVGHHVRRLMLNRLKCADRTTKRRPCSRVFDGNLKILLDQTDQVSAFENYRAIRKRVEVWDLDDVISRHVDMIENNFGELLPGHRCEGSDLNTFSSPRYSSSDEAILAPCEHP